MSPRTAMAVVFCAMLLCSGCGNRGCDEAADTTGSAGILTDAAGRNVRIPQKVSRVVSPFTMYTRLVVAVGGCDKLVGISHTCLLPEELYGCGGRLGELPDVGPFGANTELIVSLAPDLIFCSQPDVASFAARTSAAAVAVSFPEDVPMVEMFERQIELVGTALRLESQADSLKEFIRTALHPVTSVTGELPAGARPRVYFAWTSWTGDILNTVCEFDPIELAGGTNVAGDAKNFAKGERGILVSREQLIDWNPEIIFVSRYQPQHWHDGGPTSPLPVTIDDVLANPLLQSVDAVKHKRVYYTTAFCNWWPHQRALVQVLYMAKLFHPDRFEHLDVEKRGNKIFKRFYGADSLYTAMAEDLELERWK